MTQSDLFTPDSTDEIQYADALAKSVLDDEEYFIENGIIPNWLEADYLLTKDERRFLELIEENAGYIIKDNDRHSLQYDCDVSGTLFPDITPERTVSNLTIDLGMNAEANSKAVVNGCLTRGMIRFTRYNDEGYSVIDLTRRGRYYLDLLNHDDDWMEYDDIQGC